MKRGKKKKKKKKAKKGNVQAGLPPGGCSASMVRNLAIHSSADDGSGPRERRGEKGGRKKKGKEAKHHESGNYICTYNQSRIGCLVKAHGEVREKKKIEAFQQNVNGRLRRSERGYKRHRYTQNDRARRTQMKGKAME